MWSNPRVNIFVIEINWTDKATVHFISTFWRSTLRTTLRITLQITQRTTPTNNPYNLTLQTEYRNGTSLRTTPVDYPGGYLTKINTGGSAPRSNPLPFYIPFWHKRYPFYIPFIAKRYPFHIPTCNSVLSINRRERSCCHFNVVLNK